MFKNIFICLFLVSSIMIQPMALEGAESSEQQSLQEQKIISQEEKEKLTNLLPDEKKNKLTPIDRQFFGEDLFMYINGAAPAYHDYEFIALLVQQYKKGMVEITVEIYDMGTVKNAFGIYSIERSPENNYIDDIGAEAYHDESTLNFYYGTYYVKLSGMTRLGSVTESLKEIAKEITVSIKKQQEKKVKKDIQPLHYFPKEGLIKHSQKYIIKNPMGHSFLAPAYSASYETKNRAFQIIISISGTKEEVQNRFVKLKQHFSVTGAMYPRTEISDNAFLGKNNFEGKNLATTFQEYVLIIKNPPPNANEYIDAMIENINRK